MKYDAADLEKGLMHSTLKSGRRHYTVSGRCEGVVVIKVPLIKSCGGLSLYKIESEVWAGLGMLAILMFMNFLYIPFSKHNSVPSSNLNVVQVNHCQKLLFLKQFVTTRVEHGQNMFCPWSTHFLHL